MTIRPLEDTRPPRRQADLRAMSLPERVQDHASMTTANQNSGSTSRHHLFLGYDPGGANRHGVAAVRVSADGSSVEAATRTLADARSVRDWLREQSSPSALGIDTLLAWALSGNRACDQALRERYPSHAQTIIVQNSLRSSMTVNGVLVAEAARELRVPLIECHPKLLRKAALHSDPAGPKLMAALDDLDRMDSVAHPADHEADAFVAAWCASRWYFKRWLIDLYSISDEVHFPGGPAVYPWPEAVATAAPSRRSAPVRSGRRAVST